jgi:hypothetical protein
MARSSNGKDIWFSTKKSDFDYPSGYKWGYRIKAITVVLQITEHGALPCTSTKIRNDEFSKTSE